MREIVVFLIISSTLLIKSLGDVGSAQFSETRGYYDEPIDLVIHPPAKEAVAVVTLDGSWPSPLNGIKGTVSAPVRIRVEHSMVIRAAILKGDDVVGLETHSYLFRDQALKQKRPPNVSDRIDFEMASLGRDYPGEPKEIRDIFLAAPTVSLSMSDSDLFGDGGLYLNSKRKGPDWERKASMEWIDTEARVFNGGCCQVEIQGGGSRIHSLKQNFELKFKGDFGRKKMRASIFEGSEIENFDSLVLRNPTHDSWAVNQREWLENARYVNDQWSSETLHAMGHAASSQRWVHLFLNGYYWGIYALSERPDASFAASHFGGKKGQYDVFNAGRLRSGDRNNLGELYRLVSGEGIKEKEIYEELEHLLDLDNLIDYILLNLYSANKDWPHKNYWLIGHRSDRPLFRFVSWDAEIGFFGPQEGSRREGLAVSALHFSGIESKRFQSDPGGAGYLYRHLARNPEFQLRFLDRAYLHCQKGVLSPKRSARRYQRLLNDVRTLLVLESLRWGDARQDVAFRPWGENWEKKTGPSSWLFTEFFPRRSNELIGQLSKDILKPPVLVKGSGQDGKRTMNNPNPEGEIVFAKHGLDPREYWSGEVVGKEYLESTQLIDGEMIKARVHSQGKWSPILSFGGEEP